MFGGSDEFVLREILEDVDHILDLHYDLNKIFFEVQYANDLKEFELGIIDENVFNQRRNAYYNAVNMLNEKINKRN